MSAPVNPLLGTKYIYDGDGHFVSTDTVALQEVIQDYDPTMFLIWIPPEDRQPGDTHPWGILHEEPGRQPYVIMWLSEDEIQNREKILAALWRGDQRRHNVFANIDNYKAAQEILRAKAQEDAREEVIDFANHVFRSPKVRYRHNGRVYE